MEGTRKGRLIANSMMDVAIRVKSVRPFAVRQMVSVSSVLGLLSSVVGHGWRASAAQWTLASMCEDAANIWHLLLNDP